MFLRNFYDFLSNSHLKRPVLLRVFLEFLEFREVTVNLDQVALRVRKGSLGREEMKIKEMITSTLWSQIGNSVFGGGAMAKILVWYRFANMNIENNRSDYNGH